MNNQKLTMIAVAVSAALAGAGVIGLTHQADVNQVVKAAVDRALAQHDGANKIVRVGGGGE
jgi:hypothetical protein